VIELADQVGIVAGRFVLQLLQPVEDCFDAINGGQYERYRFPGDGHAVTKFAHQRFGGVRERLEPGQSKKAAGSFDGVDEAENVAENLAVIGLSLEAHQLGVDVIEVFGRLGQKLTQQLIHERLVPPTTQVWRPSKSFASTNAPQRTRESLAKAFTFGCGIGESGLEKAPFFVNATTTASPSSLAEMAKPQSRANMPV